MNVTQVKEGVAGIGSHPPNQTHLRLKAAAKQSAQVSHLGREQQRNEVGYFATKNAF